MLKIDWRNDGATGALTAFFTALLSLVFTSQLNPVFGLPWYIPLAGIIIGFFVGVVFGHFLEKFKMKKWRKGGLIGTLSNFFLFAFVIIVLYRRSIFQTTYFEVAAAIIIILLITFAVAGFLLGSGIEAIRQNRKKNS